jgi:L,D-transpeptidase ErfK/SrfK
MIPPLDLQRTLKALLAAFLALGLGRAAVHGYGFLAASGALERAVAGLDGSTARLDALEKEARAGTADAAFLGNLLAMYPENKGALRSQKAIAEDVAALRAEAGRRLAGRLHIAVDTRANKLYLKKGLRLLWEADCSVGRGGLVRDRKTGRAWQFATPRGEFTVLTKIDKPAWMKPDWAYVENGEKVPPPGDPVRKVEGELGAFALNIGDGYLLHGTKNEEALGRPASHGCIRLGAEPLEKLYKTVPVGTKVYIY